MTERRIAFLFPGQGSQHPGMGAELYRAFAECRQAFDEADAALGEGLSQRIFAGSEAELQMTEVTQPAVLTVSVAVARALAARGIRPAAVAGHSLGEYSALVAASGLGFADAVRLVRKRGRYMQEAVPVGQGAMAAVIGLEAVVVEALCAEAGRSEVAVAANYNAPDQTVVAGHAAAVERVVDLARAHGARRAVLLAVSAPFHCPLMDPAATRLEVDLGATGFHDLEMPLVTNVDARPVRRGDECRDALVRQVTRPVRWTESMRALVELGCEVFVEVGPGRVLSGLARRIERRLEVHNVSDPASLDKVLAALGGGS